MPIHLKMLTFLPTIQVKTNPLVGIRPHIKNKIQTL